MIILKNQSLSRNIVLKFRTPSLTRFRVHVPAACIKKHEARKPSGPTAVAACAGKKLQHHPYEHRTRGGVPGSMRMSCARRPPPVARPSRSSGNRAARTAGASVSGMWFPRARHAISSSGVCTLHGLCQFLVAAAVLFVIARKRIFWFFKAQDTMLTYTDVKP